MEKQTRYLSERMVGAVNGNVVKMLLPYNRKTREKRLKKKGKNRC